MSVFLYADFLNIYFTQINVYFFMTDESFPTNENYLDETMLARFNEFCSIAEKYNIKLIVGLLTGWMSGRR